MKQFEYKVQSINTKDIIVDDLGQRDVEFRKAQFKKIMREFNPNLVQDLSVAFIDGKYYCIDGQMTRKVLIAKNGGKDLAVRCKVYCGMTKMDAANMFLNQRGYVSNVDMTDKIRVRANYGDQDAVNFIRVTEENGLYISWKRQKAKGAVMAVSTLFNVFESFNDLDAYAQYIRILKKSWGGEPSSTKKQILDGLAMFCQTYKGKFDEERLISHLNMKDPNEIIRNASVDRSNGNRKYAMQILYAYNERTRENNKLPVIM